MPRDDRNQNKTRPRNGSSGALFNIGLYSMGLGFELMSCPVANLNRVAGRPSLGAKPFASAGKQGYPGKR